MAPLQLKQTLLWAVLAACQCAHVSARPLGIDVEVDVNVNVTVDTPLVNLAIAAKLNMTGLGTLIAADRARAQQLKGAFLGLPLPASKRQQGNVDVQNTAVTYMTSVGIGSPATTYNLLIDTGSANTWLGADKAYTPTSTSHDTGSAVSVKYGGGSFSGEEYTDQVDLGNGLVINAQSIGVAKQSNSFGNGIDGILGVGPADLTRGTLQSDSSATIPTVTDSLASQGTTGGAVLGMYYVPYSESDASGVLTFGGADSSLYTGALAYVGVTQTQPAAQYWGVDQAISYAGQTVLAQTAGIIDSGTTMIMLASDAYDAYVKATGAAVDQNSGFLKLTKAQYANLQPLDFHIGANTYTLTPNAQIWPRTLNTALGGDTNDVYLVIGDLGSNSGDGFDFINGYLWMERFYTVFDTPNKQIGIATTKYTNSESN